MERNKVIKDLDVKVQKTYENYDKGAITASGFADKLTEAGIRPTAEFKNLMQRSGSYFKLQDVHRVSRINKMTSVL